MIPSASQAFPMFGQHVVFVPLVASPQPLLTNAQASLPHNPAAQPLQATRSGARRAAPLADATAPRRQALCLAEHLEEPMHRNALSGCSGRSQYRIGAASEALPSLLTGRLWHEAGNTRGATCTRQSKFLPEHQVAIAMPGTVQGSKQCRVTAENILHLSRDRDGCHVAQAAFEEAANDETRNILVQGLKGHIYEVAQCPHGNHVLQKYVTTMRPSACTFIVDEFIARGAEGVCKVARHKYASRIIQRLLEHLTPTQVAALVEPLLIDAAALMQQRYGTYVLQHIVEFGTEAQKQRVVVTMRAHMHELCVNNDACMVLGKAFEQLNAHLRAALLQAILQHRGAVVAMAFMRRGHVALISALEDATEAHFEEACFQLEEQSVALRSMRYGRVVQNWIQERKNP